MTEEKQDKKTVSKISKMITNQDVKMMDKFKWKLESPALVLDLFHNSVELQTNLDFNTLPKKTRKTTTLTIINMGAKDSEVLDSSLDQIDRYKMVI